MLTGQADQARSIIPKARDLPPRADGVYAPDGGQVRRWERDATVDIHLMVFGDSTAAGYGCLEADEVPGVLLARSLAARCGAHVRLSTKALVGATSKGLVSQVDATLVAGPAPHAAVIMIGANDVTAVNGIGPSARRLGSAVSRLRSADAAVVVGTCPDLGVIDAIPQPLRWTARTLGLRLARAQADEVQAAGGVSVPLADRLRPHLAAERTRLLADDRYHPSAAGYALIAESMLPALCRALGREEAQPESALQPSATRLAPLGRLLRRTAS